VTMRRGGYVSRGIPAFGSGSRSCVGCELSRRSDCLGGSGTGCRRGLEVRLR
jgi:hypothetical protein